jgi:hypothetical protein
MSFEVAPICVSEMLGVDFVKMQLPAGAREQQCHLQSVGLLENMR